MRYDTIQLKVYSIVQGSISTKRIAVRNIHTLIKLNIYVYTSLLVHMIMIIIEGYGEDVNHLCRVNRYFYTLTYTIPHSFSYNYSHCIKDFKNHDIKFAYLLIQSVDVQTLLIDSYNNNTNSSKKY